MRNSRVNPAVCIWSLTVGLCSIRLISGFIFTFLIPPLFPYLSASPDHLLGLFLLLCRHRMRMLGQIPFRDISCNLRRSFDRFDTHLRYQHPGIRDRFANELRSRAQFIGTVSV